MATNTMVALYTAVASGSATSITLTGLSGYTDLVIEYNGTLSSTGKDLRFYVNGDNSSGLYSFTWLGGNGSSASSGRQGASNYLASYFLVGSSTTPATATYNFQNYSNSTTYKTVIARISDAGSEVISTVGLWRNTNAITSVTFYPNVGNFTNGDTFTVYGIASSDIPAYATGGFVSQDSTYWYHAFPMSGTFTPKQNLSCDILVVAGGGGGGGAGGGGAAAGGGGAGSVNLYSAQSTTSGTGYTVTVGAGGSGGTGSPASNGTNSSFASSSATGGGAGGSINGSSGGFPTSGATSGGSGGGGYGWSGTNGTGASAGSGSLVFAGGNGASSSGSYGFGGGGGGSNANGASGSSGYAGVGGNGTSAYSAWLTATGTGVNGYIAAGGGGTAYNAGSAVSGGTGGLGGGGNGLLFTSSILLNTSAGLPNTGSGGGAGGLAVNGANGGSGLIIVRYAK